MERKKKNGREEINPLLLKLAIPLALPLAGLIFSIVITRKSRSRNKTPSNTSRQELESLMDSSESTSLCEFEDEDASQVHESSSSMYQQQEKGGGGEETESTTNSAPCSEITRMQQCPQNPTEVSIINSQDQHNLVEEIGRLKCLVSAIDDRASEMESQFQDYCDAKEQESLFQKLQIMCLGYKLECLEAHHQRHEATISDQEEAMEKLKGMRAELKCLQRKVRRLSKSDRLHLLEARRKALVLDAREAELSRINEELKEVKDLADELRQGKKASDEKLESLAAKHKYASMVTT